MATTQICKTNMTLLPDLISHDLLVSYFFTSKKVLRVQKNTTDLNFHISNTAFHIM